MVSLFSAVVLSGAESRVWTMEDGRTFEAEYVGCVVGKVLLKNKEGVQVKVPLKGFSEADQKYIQLENPPELDISFFKKSKQRWYIPDLGTSTPLPTSLYYTFGVKVKQTSSGSYNHELKIECFAIGAEIHGNKYVMLDHQEHTFVLTEENDRSSEFEGRTIEVIDYQIREFHRGRKYSSFLVVVTDARGKIIAHKTPKKLLFKNLENLRKVPPGKCFDKTCTRVGPTRPKTDKY